MKINLNVLRICILDTIGCQGDIGETKAKSESAKVKCMSHDYFHVRQSDARSPRLNTTTQLPTQSSLKGKYTPWIAYRGACICKWVGGLKMELFNGRGGQTTSFVLSLILFFSCICFSNLSNSVFVFLFLFFKVMCIQFEDE